jgi:hypothetical protein
MASAVFFLDLKGKVRSLPVGYLGKLHTDESM